MRSRRLLVTGLVLVALGLAGMGVGAWRADGRLAVRHHPMIGWQDDGWHDGMRSTPAPGWRMDLPDPGASS